MQQAATSIRENWSEHQTTMFSNLHEKQKLGKYCDVVLKCCDSDQSFNAHSCVLSSASPLFDKLLQDAMNEKSYDKSESNTTGKLVVVLPEDVASSCVESLLNFIYSGNIDLSQLRLSSQEDNAVYTRKSRRSSTSKYRPSEDQSSSSTAEDSSIYAFLKASRCLEIMTLTEYLESAVTLSEMKTSELSSSEGPPRRASATKYHGFIRPVVNDNPQSPNGAESSKHKGKKKKAAATDKNAVETSKSKPTNKTNEELVQDENSGLAQIIPFENAIEESPEVINRSEADSLSNIEQQPHTEEITYITGSEVNIQLQETVEEVVGVLAETVPDDASQPGQSHVPGQSTGLVCYVCQQKFKNRAALKKHSSQHLCSEQTNQVDSFPVRTRGNKRIQCSSCEKTFTSPIVLQLHMQKHEIENSLDVRRSETPELGSSVEIKKNDDDRVGSESVNISQPLVKSADMSAKLKNSKVTPERPPRRASALKFQTMMKITFSSEDSDVSFSKTPSKPMKKGRKRQSPDSGRTKGQKAKVSKRKAKFFDKSIMDEAATKSCTEEIPISLEIENTETDELPVENSETLLMVNAVSGTIENVNFASSSLQTVESQNYPLQVPLENDLFDGFGTVQEYALSDNTEVEPRPSSTVKQEQKNQTTPKKSKRKKICKVAKDDDSTQEHMSQACDICGKVITNIKNMMNHMRSHDRPELACTVCDQKFKYKSALNKHLEWHNSDSKSCQVCNVPLYTQQERAQHLMKHNSKKMRTDCPVCKKSFTSDYVMQLHLRTHTGEELFSCDTCGKKFPYKSSLKMHQKLHTGERPFICSVCGKCFVQKIHAKEHELQHAGIRRFQCNLCERFFAHKCGLSRHIADIHHKSRPFICSTCGKTFPRKTKLIEHIRTHTGEKPYVCDICGIRYKANRSLKLHKKNRHNIVVPDYIVGIWRNGPLPTVAECKSKPLPKKPAVSVIVESKTTFDFPVDMNSVDIIENDDCECEMKDEQMIINNVTTEVDVISTDQAHTNIPSVIESQEITSRPFTYPMSTTTKYQTIQYTNASVSGVTIYQESTLPPASSLSKISNQTVIPAYPAIQGQKTFIVPLNAKSTVPVMTDQIPAGMMVTYMMPQQAIVETVEHIQVPSSTTEGFANSPALRSASVPPMSTFQQNAVTTVQDQTTRTVFQQVTPGTTTLPGMHTFQPVQLHMSTSQHLITGFTTINTGFPVLVPAAPVLSAMTTQPVTEITENNSHTWQNNE